MLSINSYERRLIGQLMAPSLFSGALAIIIGLIVTLGVILTFSLNTSSFQRELFTYQQSTAQAPKPLTQPGQSVPETDHPSIKSTWPLLIFWSVIGACAYTVTMAIVRTIQSTFWLKESLDYTNAHPAVLLKAAVEHIIVRLVAAVTLGILVNISIMRVFPYTVAASHASAVELPGGAGFLYAGLSFGVIVLSLHIETIFLRLAFGRQRVFASS